MNQRHYNHADHLLIHFDQALRTLFGAPLTTARANPAAAVQEPSLPEADRRHSAGLMRINHCGEVCAQALYQGQSLTAHSEEVRAQMAIAAQEENDHLVWCEQRLQELDSFSSRLNPFFYIGSFSIGAVAGIVGDRWSLGFVAETEHQVVDHLTGHLQTLPEADLKSRAILTQMKEDELHHATTAINAGAATLPGIVRTCMRWSAKVMTKTTYWV